MDPDSSSLVVTVTDGRGRGVADRGLARWLVRLALRLAPAVTVVEPPGLRDEVARTAAAALALYDAD